MYVLDVCVFCVCASLCVQKGTGEEEGEGSVCANTKSIIQRGKYTECEVRGRKSAREGVSVCVHIHICVCCVCASLCVRKGTGEEEGEVTVCANRIGGGGGCKKMSCEQNVTWERG